MANVRKGMLVSPGCWNKHMKRLGKKIQAHSERQAAKRLIYKERKELGL